MIPGLNNPQTIGSSPFTGGGKGVKAMLGRDAQYADGAAGSSAGAVNARAGFLPTMNREHRVGEVPVNRSGAYSPGRYSTLENAGAVVMAGGKGQSDFGSYSKMNPNQPARDQGGPSYSPMGRRQMSEGPRGSSLGASLSLGNGYASRLAD